MKKEIVFVNQTSGYLMIDIVNEFSKEFDNMVLLAGTISPRGIGLSNDVKVHRIIPYSRKNIVFRLLSWLIGFFQIQIIVLFKYPKSHLFLVSNPPLVSFLPLFVKNSFSFLIYDIYPDTLFKYKKIKQNSYLGNIWKSVNKRVFRDAMQIFTISNGMKETILSYCPNANVKVIPLWADSGFFEIIPKNENQFLKSLGLVDKFIVLYSGNLGTTHDVELLVEVANEIKNENVYFLIIGNGDKESQIRKKIQEYGLKNCQLMDLQPVNMLSQTLGGASIGVVATGKGSGNLSVPSKAFSLIAAGKPLLCISDRDSELTRLVDEMEIGKSFTSDELKKMVDFISTLANDIQLQKFYELKAKEASGRYSKNNVRKFVESFVD
jgi:glycosyltransferase involved in cell wall biosynthesis